MSDKLQFVEKQGNDSIPSHATNQSLSDTFGGYTMKKLLTQTFVLLVAMTITISTFAQSPGNATRQRRTAMDGTLPAVDKDAKPSDDPASDTKTDKGKRKQAPEVTADGKTNRTDEASDEEAIVP